MKTSGGFGQIFTQNLSGTQGRQFPASYGISYGISNLNWGAQIQQIADRAKAPEKPVVLHPNQEWLDSRIKEIRVKL